MWQLIHTSAPAGLNPGQTGFCTVARHHGIPQRLVVLLESLSAYDPPAGVRPVIFTYRLIIAGNDAFGVLSRYCDAGLDYTHRRNHLAHHLVLNATEMAGLPPPAEVAARWPFWRDTWQNAPQWLEDSDATGTVSLQKAETRLPAVAWRDATGDAANAARLCPEGAPVEVLLQNLPAVSADATTLPLRLFAEASLLLQNGPWSAGFTTQVQPTDNFSQTPWRSNSYEKNHSAKNVIDFQSLPALPGIDTPVARYARTGIPPHKQPQAAASPLFSRRPRQTLWTAENVPADATAPNSRHLRWILAAALGAMVVIGILAWQLFLRNNAGTAPPPSGHPPSEHIPTKPINATQIQNTIAEEMLRRDLEAAVGALNWPRAAELWQKLRAANAAENSRDPELLSRIQRHLANALADATEPIVADVLNDPAAQKLIAGRATLSRAREQIAAIAATVSPTTKARFSKFEAQLQLLENLPEAATPMAFFTWKTPPPSEAVAGQRRLSFTSVAMHQFLSRPHQGTLTLTLAAFENLAKPEARDAQTFTLAAATDYVEKKVLLLRPAAGAAARLHMNPSKNVLQPGIVYVEHFPGPNADAVERAFSANPHLLLTLASPDATVTQLFVSAEKPPPPLISTIQILERDTTGTLILPRWLRSVLSARFPIPNTELVLLSATDPAVAPHLPVPPQDSSRRCLPLVFFQ